MVGKNHWNRYTFPFVSHSNAYVEDLGDQFWILGSSSRSKNIDVDLFEETARKKVNRRRYHRLNNQNGQADRKLCPPCKKLKKFKENQLDPAIHNAHIYIADKADDIRIIRELIKSPEFKEIRQKCCNKDLDNKQNPIEKIRTAANETLLLFKIKKSDIKYY